MFWRTVLLTSLVFASGCSDAVQTPATALDGGMDADGGDDSSGDPGPTALVVPEGCNPVAAQWDCLLPYPSDHFVTPDETLPSGRRVALTPQSVAIGVGGAPINLMTRDPADGFSWISPILSLFPDGIDGETLTPVLGDYARSATVESPTLVIRAADGLAAAHIAELDPRADSDARRALVMHPVAPLEENTRYIVAMHGLVTPSGAPVTAPAEFTAIRDGTAYDHPALSALAERYDREIFPVLEEFGIERSSLQLAWDFTTGTRAHAARDMLHIRADAITIMEEASPPVTILEVGESEDGFRVVEGTMEVPLYLTDETTEGVLSRGTSGVVERTGAAEVPFLMLIPPSVLASTEPARVLQFGHGFFGDRTEASGGAVRSLLDSNTMVGVAVDWWGMSEVDRFVVAGRIATEPNRATVFLDRVHQAMVNQIALTYALRGELAEQGATQVDGTTVYDPEEPVYFYGISQGHILGGTYLALAPHVERGVLSVGGGGLSRMMFRALPFLPFLYVVASTVPDPLDQQKWTAMSQSVFDRIDPITYAPWVHDGGPQPRPARRTVLLQVGIGDASVPNLTAHLHARALGIHHLTPAPRALFGLPEATTPHAGSAIAEWDYGVDPQPGVLADFPESGNEVHEAVRREPTALEQIDLFLRPDGAIVHTCDGPCDPD